MSQHKTTEESILAAAQKTFIKKGFDGASMQDIANEAGINKALLHYYFRNKQRLFDTIFMETFTKFIPPAFSVMASEQPVSVRIEQFVELYIDVIRENPLIPLFILNELQRSPERLVEMLGGMGIQPSVIVEIFKKEMDAGHIRRMDPHQLIINILSLCVFPFVARPLLISMFFNHDQEAFEAFLEDRKRVVAQFINQAIQLQ